MVFRFLRYGFGRKQASPSAQMARAAAPVIAWHGNGAVACQRLT